MPVSVVHEEMHERTSCQEQVRQGAKDVRGVLGQKEKAPDGEEPAQDEPERASPPGCLDLFTHESCPSRSSKTRSPMVSVGAPRRSCRSGRRPTRCTNPRRRSRPDPAETSTSSAARTPAGKWPAPRD